MSPTNPSNILSRWFPLQGSHTNLSFPILPHLYLDHIHLHQNHSQTNHLLNYKPLLAPTAICLICEQCHPLNLWAQMIFYTNWAVTQLYQEVHSCRTLEAGLEEERWCVKSQLSFVWFQNHIWLDWFCRTIAQRSLRWNCFCP